MLLAQIGKVLYDKLTEGACCLREIMLLMPGYSKGPLTGGIRQVKCCEGFLFDLFLHQRRRESYTEMGFDEFKEDRWLIYFIHNTRCEACLLAKMVYQVAETAADFFNHHSLVGYFTKGKGSLERVPEMGGDGL